MVLYPKKGCHQDTKSTKKNKNQRQFFCFKTEKKDLLGVLGALVAIEPLFWL